MLLAELVRTSDAVAATPSRTEKLDALTTLLRKLAPEEIHPAVAFLAGQPWQGKVGAGWATRHAVDPTPALEPSIEVLELDRAISELQSLSGPGSATTRRARVGELLGRATAAEADFIRRLLVGALRQGALEGVMTDAVARAAAVQLAVVRRAVMLAGDLARVAAMALVGGQAALSDIRLEVLRPIRSMLASTSEDVATELSELGRCSIEWKLDGIRIQAHRRGVEVRLYTRNLNEVTERLPGVVTVLLGLDVEQVVLDGEILGEPAEVWFFDCLHLDGEDLLDRPLLERSAVLDRIGAPRIPSLVTSEVDPAVAFETEALARRPRRGDGEKGVVTVRGGTTRRRVAEGEACADARPRRPRRRVGQRPPWGLALDPAPWSPPPRGRLRDGRQDLQGPHRRTAGVADG